MYFSGSGILAALRKVLYEDEIDIVQTFELHKRTVLPHQTQPVKLRIPLPGLCEVTEDLFGEGESVAERLKKCVYGDKISIKRDLLMIDAEVFKKFFKPAIDKIIRHVGDLMKKPNVVNCKNILMVGGFSESPILQEAIKEAFPNHNIMIPEEAGLAVLRGSLMFGLDPAVTPERICRYTYGIEVVCPFESSKHPQSKKIPTVLLR